MISLWGEIEPHYHKVVNAIGTVYMYLDLSQHQCPAPTGIDETSEGGRSMPVTWVHDVFICSFTSHYRDGTTIQCSHQNHLINIQGEII